MTTFSFTELEAEAIEMLPEKETLFLNFNWANVHATNTSLAVNAGTLFSAAMSSATQNIAVIQG